MLPFIIIVRLVDRALSILVLGRLSAKKGVSETVLPPLVLAYQKSPLANVIPAVKTASL